MEQTVDVEITDGLEQLQTAICNSLDLALKDGVDMDVALDAIKKTVKEAIPDVDMNNIVDDIYLRWYEFVKGE